PSGTRPPCGDVRRRAPTRARCLRSAATCSARRCPRAPCRASRAPPSDLRTRDRSPRSAVPMIARPWAALSYPWQPPIQELCPYGFMRSGRPDSAREQIVHLDDELTVRRRKRTRRETGLLQIVVDDVDVAARPVDDVEADAVRHLAGERVVLAQAAHRGLRR